MTKEEDLYNDRPTKNVDSDISDPISTTRDVFKEYELGIDSESSIINLSGPVIHGKTLLDITSKIRLLLKLRSNPEAPINLIINSEGGYPSEVLGIVDYIKSLDIPVNTICRGVVGGEACDIFNAATGKRFMSKRSILKIGSAHKVSVSALNDKLIDYIIEDKPITKT